MHQLVCVGSYTPAGEGITLFRRDPLSGTLTPAGAIPLDSPSWLTWHPAVPVLYAANETTEGAVTALALDPDGTLRILNRRPSGGAHPCHLAVTPDGRNLLCANYTSGSIAVFALDADGRLADRTDLVHHHGHGPDAERQEAAHPHMAVPGPSGLVSVVDLGTDEIRGYRLSAGTLTPLAVCTLPPGTGPRQLVRRHGTDLAYVVGELAGTLTTLREGPAGEFTVLDTIGATARADGPNLAAHLAFTPEGGLLLSNRGPDCVTVFDLRGDFPVPLDDRPSGAWPRQFAVLGDHYYVAAQSAHAVVAFTLAGKEIARYPVGSPAFVTAAPDYQRD